MNDVWIINLKDNRTGHNKNDDKKFNFCLDEGIIGIGWANNSSQDGIGYVRAKKGIEGMKRGDLVWTKNPKTREKYYLFKVKDDKPTVYVSSRDARFIKNDIGSSRKVEKMSELSECDLPEIITKRDIIARSTVQKVHIDRLINATHNYVVSLEGE